MGVIGIICAQLWFRVSFQILFVYNYSRRRSALGLVQLRLIGGSNAKYCVDQYMVLFRYYLLRGDTGMPGGLHAGCATRF